MGYPDCGNLEWVIRGIHATPELMRFGSELLGVAPLSRFKDIDTGLQLLLEETYPESSLNPTKGQVSFADRIQLLPRLPDGEYEALIPEFESKVGGSCITVPEQRITLAHRRVYHPSAKLDLDRLSRQDPEDRFLLKTSTDTSNLGFVEEMANLEVVDHDFCTVYSTFTGNYLAPSGWAEAAGAFEDLYVNVIVPFLTQRKGEVEKMIEEKVTAKHIKNAVLPKEKAFLAPHQKTIEDYLAHQDVIRELHARALRRVIGEYCRAIRTSPTVFDHKKPAHLAIDSDRRILEFARQGPFRPLTTGDVMGSKYHTIESLPFSAAFGDLLRDRLKKPPVSREPYENNAQRILHDSFEALNQIHYDQAIKHAATALEVVLRGFIIHQGVMTREELGADHTISIPSLVGRLFDEAVARDSSYSGPKQYVFPRRLRRKLLGAKQANTTDRLLSATEIRNDVVHWGELSKLQRPPNYWIARVVCEVYAESISYVMERGWRNPQKPYLASDVLRWVAPELDGILAQQAGNEVVCGLQEQLRSILPWIHPIERENMKRDVSACSWAYGILHEKPTA